MTAHLWRSNDELYSLVATEMATYVLLSLFFLFLPFIISAFHLIVASFRTLLKPYSEICSQVGKSLKFHQMTFDLAAAETLNVILSFLIFWWGKLDLLQYLNTLCYVKFFFFLFMASCVKQECNKNMNFIEMMSVFFFLFKVLQTKMVS